MTSNERKFQHAKLVRIDSKDRETESRSQYDFKTSTNDFMLHNIKRVILKSVIIPNTQYNINIHNNKLYYTAPSIGPTVNLITVPVGKYKAAQFFDILIALFLLDSIVMTYVIDLITAKVTLTFNTPISLQGDISTMNKVVGMDLTITPASVSVLMPNIINFAGLQKVYVGSHTLTRGIAMSSSDKRHIKIFTEVPITVPYGGVEHRTIEDITSLDESTMSIPINLSNIDITLYDQDLNIVDLNGLDIQLVLKVFTQ